MQIYKQAAIHGSGSWANSPLGTASGIGCSISGTIQLQLLLYVLSYIPLMTGTGEQIIRTALARVLCERADPNHCEDTVSGIESGFKLFSGMQVLLYH